MGVGNIFLISYIMPHNREEIIVCWEVWSVFIRYLGSLFPLKDMLDDVEICFRFMAIFLFTLTFFQFNWLKYMFKIRETTQNRAQMLATKFITIALMHFVTYRAIKIIYTSLVCYPYENTDAFSNTWQCGYYRELVLSQRWCLFRLK